MTDARISTQVGRCTVLEESLKTVQIYQSPLRLSYAITAFKSGILKARMQEYILKSGLTRRTCEHKERL